ncbi:hypothetical protein [Pseudomonas sp. Q1-7]|uniref:hypothetical protein n=1 Tax=Pseudomonas sp. Q1-7 TaxID=3020843 RepID=UPI0023016A37|nr:hypothetical protein [Pseudomonas sp. Q1-7]
MLEAIRTFFTLYWHIVIPLVATVFLAIPVIVYWYEFRYWLMKVRIGMPWRGRIAHWVKHPGSKDEPSSDNPNAVGFYESEAQLCRLYETYYRNHQPSESHFKRCQDYLGKIDEDARKEKGILLWGLIIALMLIEATAFGFALAPFALTLATPNTAIAGAFAIGLVISIIGLFLSEFAGRQMYLNNVVAKILSFENMRSAGSAGDMVRTHIVTIDNTNVDDDKPHYQQMLNRVKLPKDGEKPAKRFGLIIGYAVFIIGLAIAAFWVRTETLNAQEADLIANPPAVSQSADDFPTASEDDFPMPTDMQGIANEAAGKSAQDQIDALHRASLVTFAVLSGLFIFIQLTSTFLAYIYGFAGTYSRVAWELIHKFSSADDFVRYHEAKARNVATDAQESLGKLQTLQLSVFRANGTDREQLKKDNIKRTFSVFISEQDSKLAFKRQKEVLDKLGNDSQQVIRSYIEKAIADLQAAIATDDNARIQEIIRTARPRFAQIKDPALFPFRDKFNGIVEMFSADVNHPAAAPASTPAPVVAPVAASPVEEAVPVPAAPAVQAAPAVASAPAAGGFDPYQFGDLTEFHDDDLAFVAQRKGTDLDTIKRARRLQLLDKSSSQPA